MYGIIGTIRNSGAWPQLHEAWSSERDAEMQCVLQAERTARRYWYSSALWPATWSNASLTHGKHITKRHRRSSWSMEKAVTCKLEAKGHHTTLFTFWKGSTIIPKKWLWPSAELKLAIFRAKTQHNRLFSQPPLEENTLFRVISITAILNQIK